MLLGNDPDGVYLQVGKGDDAKRPCCVAQGNFFKHASVNDRWVGICTGKVGIFLGGPRVRIADLKALRKPCKKMI